MVIYLPGQSVDEDAAARRTDAARNRARAGQVRHRAGRRQARRRHRAAQSHPPPEARRRKWPKR